MSSDICPSKISYLTNPIVFHRKIPAWLWYRWARMFFPPQSGLAGARVSSMYHLLVNRKKASRWCSRIYTLGFGGTASYNSGVHTPMGCWDWGCRQPLARLEQGASHGRGVTGQGHVEGGSRKQIGHLQACCCLFCTCRCLPLSGWRSDEGVMLLLCLSLRHLVSPALVSAPPVAATGACTLDRFGLLAETCEVELRGYLTRLVLMLLFRFYFFFSGL